MVATLIEILLEGRESLRDLTILRSQESTEPSGRVYKDEKSRVDKSQEVKHVQTRGLRRHSLVLRVTLQTLIVRTLERGGS